MTKKVYEKEFKDQLVKEAVEVGNTSLVARKHGVSQKSLNNWVHALKGVSKKRSLRNLEQVRKDIDDTPEQYNQALRQNDKLKSLLGERELEIAVLRDLLKKTNTPLPTR